MEMKKGVCVKNKNDRSIFLLEDGRFLEGKAVNALEVGEEGYFVPASHRSAMTWAKLMAPVSALAAALLLLLFTMLPSEDAYAYIQLEAEPGLEIGIDEDIKVVSIRHLNEDGKKIIDKLGEWDGHSLADILSKSIGLAAGSTSEDVTITTVAGEPGDYAELPVEQAVLAVAVAAEKKNVEIRLKKATHKQWKNSLKEQVPVGQKVKEFTPVVIEEGSGPLQTKSMGITTMPIQPEEKGPALPPGQQKKENADIKVKNGKEPPGQVKKAETAEKPKPPAASKPEKPVSPPGQEKKTQAPGQVKKTEPQKEKIKETPKIQERKAAPKAEVKKMPPQAKEKKPPIKVPQEKVKAPGKVKPKEKVKNTKAQGTVKNQKTPEQKKKNNGSQKTNSKDEKGQK